MKFISIHITLNTISGALGFRGSKSNSVCFITCLSNPGKGKHMSQWNTIEFRLSVDILPCFNLSHKMNHIKVCPNSVYVICYVESLLLLLRESGQRSSLCLPFFFQLPIRIVASPVAVGVFLPPGRKRSMPLVHQTCHCCQNTSGE